MSESWCWVDTHCHLDFEEYSGDLPAVLSRARAENVRYFIVPGTRGESDARDFSQGMFKAWGVHPLFAGKFDEKTIREQFSHRNFSPCAIGECGFDADVEVSLQRQEEVFAAQVGLAVSLKLPLLLHLRGSWEKTLGILRERAKGIPWVLHTFCGSVEIARQFLKEEEAFISFSGSICYLKAKKTPAVARMVPDDRILLETDCPDIIPPFWPGKINEPASLPGIAVFLAKLRGCTPEYLGKKVWDNTQKVFPFIF